MCAEICMQDVDQTISLFRVFLVCLCFKMDLILQYVGMQVGWTLVVLNIPTEVHVSAKPALPSTITVDMYSNILMSCMSKPRHNSCMCFRALRHSISAVMKEENE